MSDNERTPDEPAATTPDETVFRVMTVESVFYDLNDASPQLQLMEADDPYRNLSIPIALPDAYALHNAMHGIAGKRPSTHELTSTILNELRSDIIAARIVRFEQGVFYAELDVMTARGRERFDCRTSDALILALRQKIPAPILCDEAVLRHF